MKKIENKITMKEVREDFERFAKNDLLIREDEVEFHINMWIGQYIKLSSGEKIEFWDLCNVVPVEVAFNIIESK